MNDEDLLIENIIAHKKTKEKVDGKAKGNRTELGLCKLLSEHFGTEFSKAPGSGAIATIRESRLPEHAKKTLTGDICVPEKFKWVIESKGGYEDDINFTNVLDGKGISRIDEFIEQVTRDSIYCGRKPIICWKRNRKPWAAMIWDCELDTSSRCKFAYRVHYRDWVIVSLEDLLRFTEKGFWFDV
jgi:hypothetical protein